MPDALAENVVLDSWTASRPWQRLGGYSILAPSTVCPIDQTREVYEFEVSCQRSVPQAIRAFLESDDFEHAVRMAVSIGGDSDTIACMAGWIAQAFYGGVPEGIAHRVFEILDEPLGDVTRRFTETFGCP